MIGSAKFGVEGEIKVSLTDVRCVLRLGRGSAILSTDARDTFAGGIIHEGALGNLFPCFEYVWMTVVFLFDCTNSLIEGLQCPGTGMAKRASSRNSSGNIETRFILEELDKHELKCFQELIRSDGDSFSEL